MRVAASRITEQLTSVLGAWGMSAAHAAITAELMVEADLRGVDSHGVSMLPSYDQEFRAGRLHPPGPETVRDARPPPSSTRPPGSATRSRRTPCTAPWTSAWRSAWRRLGGQLPPLRRGRVLLGDRVRAGCRRHGHLVDARRLMVPTFGAEAVMGTNPFAFAAPRPAPPALRARHGHHHGGGGPGPGAEAPVGRSPPGGSSTGTASTVTDRGDGHRAGGRGVRRRHHAARRLVAPSAGTRATAWRSWSTSWAGCSAGRRSRPSATARRARRSARPRPHLPRHRPARLPGRRRVRGRPRSGRRCPALDTPGGAGAAGAGRGRSRAAPSRRERMEQGVPIPDDLMDQLRAVVARAGVPFVLA